MGDEFAEFVVSEALLRRREKRRTRAKERYHSDAAYREARKADARARYVPSKTSRARKRGRNKPRPYTLRDGRVILLIGLGEAADRLGLSKKTLRGYEDRGVVPINRQIDSRGRRWYPAEFIGWLAPLLCEQSKRREPLWSLRQRVERSWKEIILAGTMPILSANQESISD